MNLDHVFIELGLNRNSKIDEIAVVRTNYKGKVLATCNEIITDDRRVITTSIINSQLIRPFPDQYVIISRYANEYKELINFDKFKNKPWLDISQLSWPLGYSDMITDRELDTLCKHFGIIRVNESVTNNCEALVRVYWALMKRYKTALLGEEAVRDFGGEALSTVRNFLGI